MTPKEAEELFDVIDHLVNTRIAAKYYGWRVDGTIKQIKREFKELLVNDT